MTNPRILLVALAAAMATLTQAGAAVVASTALAGCCAVCATNPDCDDPGFGEIGVCSNGCCIYVDAEASSAPAAESARDAGAP